MGYNLGWVLSLLNEAESLLGAKRSNDIALYNNKKETILLMKNKLETPFPNYNTFEQALYGKGKASQVDRLDEESLALDVQKLFSEDINFRYSQITAILQEWRRVDADLRDLLENIYYGEPEKYSVVIDAIKREQNEDYSLSDVLDHLSINAIVQNTDYKLKNYDYRNLQEKYNEIEQQYYAAAKALMEDMLDEIAAVN